MRGVVVAGAGLEPATFGLWAQRAATAPPRNEYKSISNWIFLSHKKTSFLMKVKSSTY